MDASNGNVKIEANVQKETILDEKAVSESNIAENNVKLVAEGAEIGIIQTIIISLEIPRIFKAIRVINGTTINLNEIDTQSMRSPFLNFNDELARYAPVIIMARGAFRPAIELMGEVITLGKDNLKKKIDKAMAIPITPGLNIADLMLTFSPFFLKSLTP